MAFYAMLVLQHDAIGLVATNTELKIGLPPWGGSIPALGNNPFAVAIPAGQAPAVVLDMSVIATRPQGEPEAPATSSRASIGSDFMARPVIGDHKGYGLALVLEILTGVLTGAGFGRCAPEPLAPLTARHNLGHLFAVLNPAIFMPLAQFTTHMEQLRQGIIHTLGCRVWSASCCPKLEHERRQERLHHGIRCMPMLLLPCRILHDARAASPSAVMMARTHVLASQRAARRAATSRPLACGYGSQVVSAELAAISCAQRW